MSWSYNPNIAVTTLVWANPRSLATTYGITFVFFSSAYLDVSVQRVCPPIGVLCLQHSGLPHSGIYGSIVCASPRNFSQLITPFIASESLGIPHTPLFCLLYNYKLMTVLRLVSQQYVCFLLFKYFYLNMSMNFFPFGTVENNGVEPLTSCVQGRRSSQLS